MKTIREHLEQNSTYQQALEIAPDDDREKIMAFNDNLIKTFEDLAGKLQQINDDPELQKRFLAELQKRQG